MRVLDTSTLAEHGPTRLARTEYELPDGRVKTMAVVHRPDAVVVLPLRDRPAGLQVFLAEQPRPAVNTPRLIEAVAGKMDPGETDPLVTGARELAEEVGYAADRWHLLRSDTVVSPGYTTERVHLLICWGMTSVPSREEDAHITGRWMLLRDALALVDMGMIFDLKTMAILLLAERGIRRGYLATPDLSAPAGVGRHVVIDMGSGPAAATM